MKRAAVTIALALWVAPAMANGPVPTRIPLFARTLSFALPDGLVLANNRNNGTNVLMEYVPKGETLGNWTRLVTIQAYRGLGRSPMPTATIARQAFFPAACSIGPHYAAGDERMLAGSIRRTIVTSGCASLPGGAYPLALKGAGEGDYVYIFRDADTIYTLNYAVRGAGVLGRAGLSSPDQAEARLREQFGSVELR